MDRIEQLSLVIATLREPEPAGTGTPISRYGWWQWERLESDGETWQWGWKPRLVTEPEISMRLLGILMNHPDVVAIEFSHTIKLYLTHDREIHEVGPLPLVIAEAFTRLIGLTI